MTTPSPGKKILALKRLAPLLAVVAFDDTPNLSLGVATFESLAGGPVKPMGTCGEAVNFLEGIGISGVRVADAFSRRLVAVALVRTSMEDVPRKKTVQAPGAGGYFDIEGAKLDLVERSLGGTGFALSPAALFEMSDKGPNPSEIAEFVAKTASDGPFPEAWWNMCGHPDRWSEHRDTARQWLADIRAQACSADLRLSTGEPDGRATRQWPPSP